MANKADPLAFSIPQVCELSALGRTRVYEAIREGALVARKHGRRTVILRSDLEAFLGALPSSMDVACERPGQSPVAGQ
jgi:excisionase family DNA binding protein